MSQQWNPLHDLIHLQDRMNRLFEDATQRRARTSNDPNDDYERGDWTPASDIYENEASYLISMDLPGIDRSTLEVDVDENRLTVRGNRIIDENIKQRSERPRGKFLRTFTVPSSVDQSKVSAEYKDGVLHIQLPKRKETKAQRVEIKIS